MTPPDDLTLIHRRVVQVVAIAALIAALVGGGYRTGQFLTSIETTLSTLNISVTRLTTQIEVQAQERSADRLEMQLLRERVERLERAIAR